MQELNGDFYKENLKNTMGKTHSIPTKTHTVMMTPTTLQQVEDVVKKKLLWKLGASGQAACRRIVKDAIRALPDKYPYAHQMRAYLVENGRLEKLLEKLGE
jgi:hypothetical protein